MNMKKLHYFFVMGALILSMASCKKDNGSSPVLISGITMGAATATVSINGTQQLTATYSPANATNTTLIWSSSNTAVATVSSTGLVTGVAPGTAVITVSDQSKTKTAICTITVTSEFNHNLSGYIKGTLMQDSTYYLTDNVTINKGDTLTIKPGVKVKANGNFSFNVSGDFICVGTEAKPILLTTSFASPVVGFGYWGGIQADSAALNIVIKYTHINWTGGPAADLSTQACIDVEGTQAADYHANIVIEDNWFFASVDDGIHLAGQIHASIKRNVLQHMGGPDGETMNIKKGVTGDIAYNYIWCAANNGIKLNTGSALPETAMNIFNNTIINGGWRKVGEFTNGILIDANAVANIYNNILVGNYHGINITNKADYSNCMEGNNLVYALDDTLAQYLFPGQITAAASDITGASLSLCNSVFSAYDPSIDITDPVTSDLNVPSLASNSPAKNAGTTTLTGSSKVPGYFSPNITGASNDVLNKDMGAYPTDGSGNKHMPSSEIGMK